MVTPEQWSEMRHVLVSASFATVCGAISYLLKRKEGEKFKWTEFVLHLGASAIAGIIAYHIIHYAGMPPDLSGALCGVAGWFGTRVMRIFEVYFVNRLGLSKEILDEVNREEQK